MIALCGMAIAVIVSMVISPWGNAGALQSGARPGAAPVNRWPLTWLSCALRQLDESITVGLRSGYQRSLLAVVRPLDVVCDTVQDLVDRERLVEEAIRISVECQRDRLGVGRHHHDRDVDRAVIGAELPHRLRTIHDRHVYVYQDECWRIGQRCAN